MYKPKRLLVTHKTSKRYLSACLAVVMLLSLFRPLTALAATPTYTIKYADGTALTDNKIDAQKELVLEISTDTASTTVTLPTGLKRTTAPITATDSTSAEVTVTETPASTELEISLSGDTAPYTITVPVEPDYDALKGGDGTITVGGTTLTVESDMPTTDFELKPSLYKYDSATGGMGAELDTTHGIDKLTDDLVCYFKFHIEDAGKYLSDCGFQPGVRYPLPTVGLTIGIAEIPITDGTNTYGKLHLSADGKNYVIFSDAHCHDVEVGFLCHVADTAEVHGYPGKFEITLPGDKKVTFPVTAEAAKGPELKKEVGTTDDAGVTTWTITYSPAEPTYTGDQPTQLVDTLPDGLAYVDGSFEAVKKMVIPKPQRISPSQTRR